MATIVTTTKVPAKRKASCGEPAVTRTNGIVKNPAELDEGALYWWLTSGQDLTRMMEEADYPEQTKQQFLDFYREVICPLLGGRPEPGCMPTAVGWDGNPFEYSWEFKGSTKKAGVRFVLDLSEVRPPNAESPMSLATVEKVLDVLSKKSPLYNDHWVSMVIFSSSTFVASLSPPWNHMPRWLQN